MERVLSYAPSLCLIKRFLSDQTILWWIVGSMSEEQVIGRRFVIVIPKSIRNELAVREGQRVLIRIERGRIVIEPLPFDPYSIMEEVVGESYEEKEEESRAEEWLKSRAGR